MVKRPWFHYTLPLEALVAREILTAVDPKSFRSNFLLGLDILQIYLILNRDLKVDTQGIEKICKRGIFRLPREREFLRLLICYWDEMSENKEGAEKNIESAFGDQEGFYFHSYVTDLYLFKKSFEKRPMTFLKDLLS